MQICQNSLLTGKNPTEGSTFHYRGVGAQHNYASAFRAKGRFPSPPGAAQRRAPTAPNYCYVNPSAPRSCQGAGQHPGHHIWGAGNILGVGGELRDRAASSLINPCSKKKNPTRGCRATPPSALLRQPQTSAFSASFLPRASQGLRFWRRHTWLVPPRPPKTGVLAARLQPWASDLSLPPPGSPRAPRRPGQHPRFSPPRHKKNKKSHSGAFWFFF